MSKGAFCTFMPTYHTVVLGEVRVVTDALSARLSRSVMPRS